jgi:hypothetical protein
MATVRCAHNLKLAPKRVAELEVDDAVLGLLSWGNPRAVAALPSNQIIYQLNQIQAIKHPTFQDSNSQIHTFQFD